MSDSAEGSSAGAGERGRGRGRGKSRGGLGKYLRARGRGRGRGRPAEFGKRLVLDGEEVLDLDEEEQKAYERELQQKFGRRQLGTNADRYVEFEPELDSEGEEVVEPEVDLSAFLERQRLSPGPSSAPPPPDEDEDIDTTVAQIGKSQTRSKKGRVQQIEWDEELENMSREKAAARRLEVNLKARFRAQTAKQRGRASPRGASTLGQRSHAVEAPPLPTDSPGQAKGEKEDMQDFLDDLLG
ncbi:hypothetical protein LXA43DRAFT_890266 [Ganoderma leucocontextum]|nr:hypothetical protein LXA43DRAFT_890266 [Ganoderma leucocontextum]